MSRIRTVKPEFWGHPKVCRVSRDARLLFVGLLNEADDYGSLRWSAKRIAGALFPYDDDVDADAIDTWVTELAEVGLVQRYEVDGAPLLLVVGFTDHQKVSHPAKDRLPSPNGAEPLPSDARVPLEGLASPSGEGAESLSRNVEGNREQGTGKGTGSTGGRGATAVPDPFPVEELREWASEQVPGVALDREIEKPVDWSRSKGVRKKDWVATARNWLRKAAEGAPGRGPPMQIGSGPPAKTRRRDDGTVERFMPGAGWIPVA